MFASYEYGIAGDVLGGYPVNLYCYICKKRIEESGWNVFITGMYVDLCQQCADEVSSSGEDDQEDSNMPRVSFPIT